MHGAAITAKAVAWPTAQASGDGHHNYSWHSERSTETKDKWNWIDLHIWL